MGITTPLQLEMRLNETMHLKAHSTIEKQMVIFPSKFKQKEK